MRRKVKAKEKLPERVVLENSPKYSSASNGAEERAIRALTDQLRILRFHVEGRYGIRTRPNSKFWPRLVRHAAFLVSRHAGGADGIAAFRAAYDRNRTWR